MAIHTTLFPHLYLLFLVVFAATPESSDPLGVRIISDECRVTMYRDLCVSSITSYLGSSNFTDIDVTRVAVQISIDNVTDTRLQISKMLRGSLDPASRRALEVCENQYDMAIYNLTTTMQYFKSDAFNKTLDYNPIFQRVNDAYEYCRECVSMLYEEKGVGAPIKQRTETVRQIVENASDIIGFKVV